jgi:Ca-activated chloride channel family protein
MSLGTPWMLLLFPLVAFAGWLMARSRRLQREAACRLKGVAAEDGRGRLSRGDWLTLAALVCVVVALARPQWNPRPYEIDRRGRDLVIALDVSRSMLAADIFPSRLEMARIAIHEALPAFAGQRVALVTFAGSAAVRVPMTLDHEFVRYMLERADPSDMDLGSTSLQAAFEKVAGTVLTDAAGGRRDLVVFTDGEDHLSDIGKAAQLLAQCGARVLIIGLGDPVRGARVPDALDENQWMWHNNVEVVSRLEEDTLTEIADQGSNVTYFSARTRPFDLVSLYQQLIAGAGDDVVVGGLRQVRYTEGYPLLLALAVVLWLASSPWKVPKMQSLVLLTSLALLVPGCVQRVEDDGEAAFRARFEQGSELLKSAQEQADADAFAERSLLVDSREEFLRAALLRPGDIETARRITTIARRLREVETVIDQKRAEEEQRQEKLAETIRRLEKLTVRQKRLAQRSQRVLRRPPIPSGEDANLPEPLVATEQLLPQDELNQLAGPLTADQQVVRKETASVLDRITVQRDTLREILTRAYGDVDKLPPTEVDPVVNLLSETVAAQDEALVNLEPGAVVLPQANTALHTAAGRMEQALDALSKLLPPKTDEDDETMASRNSGEYDDTMDGPDSESQDKRSQPVSPGDFQEALSLRSLPIPEYTSAEIMAEEAANQKERARRKAARAGAKVEKNW